MVAAGSEMNGFFEIKKFLDLNFFEIENYSGWKIVSFLDPGPENIFSVGVERIQTPPGPGAGCGARFSEIKILRSRFCIFLISIPQGRVGGRHKKSDS